MLTIEKLNNEKKELSGELARALEKNIGEYRGGAGFLYELLQNADDELGESDSKTVTIHFSSKKNTLSLHYDGRPFEYRDVERLCSYRKDDIDDKSRDINKTGYMGIGFKAAFSVASRVSVHSGEYSFCFDRSVWEKKDVPWMITPIWVEKNEIGRSVNILLEINSLDLSLMIKDGIVAILNQLVSESTRILFLRNVCELKLNIDDSNHSIQIKRQGKAREILVNSVSKSKWIVLKRREKLDDETWKKLPKDFPEKFTKKREVEIDFGIKIDGQSIIPLDIGKVYVQLPTSVNFTWPFHVNSFFLLNLTRTSLKVEYYNLRMMRAIACAQVDLLRTTACGKNSRVLLDFLTVNHFKGSDEECEIYNSYNDEYQRLLLSKPILPSAFQPGILIKLHEAVADEIGFFKKFGEIAFPQKNRVISYDLAHVDRLRGMKGICWYNFDTLVKEINDSKTKLLDKIIKAGKYEELIVYLWETAAKKENRDIIKIQALRSCKFILAKNGKFFSPQETVYILASKYVNDFPGQESLNIISISQFKEAYSIIHEFFVSDLSMKILDDMACIEKTLELLDGLLDRYEKRQSDNDYQKIVEVTRFLFTFRRFLKREDLDRVWLLDKNKNIAPGKMLYLPDELKPLKPLEGKIDDPALYVSTVYIPEEVTEKVKEQWAKFFEIKLKVSGQIHFINLRSYTVGAALHDQVHKLNDYLSFLLSGVDIHGQSFKPSPSKYMSPEARSKHSWGRFPMIDFIWYFNDKNKKYRANYRKIFWAIFQKHWSAIKGEPSDIRKTHYKMPRGVSRMVPDYLAWFLSKQSKFRSSSGQDMSSSELFAPSLSGVVTGAFHYAKPIVNLTFSLEQEFYIGFRTHLNSDHVRAILKNLSERGKLDHNIIKQYMRLILYVGQNKIDLKVEGGLKLLSSEGSWRAKSDLFLPSEQAIKMNMHLFSQNFVMINDSYDIEALLNGYCYFGVKDYGVSEVKVVKQGKENADFKKRLSDFMPILVYCLIYLGHNEKELIIKLKKKFSNLTIREAEIRDEKTDSRLRAGMSGDTLYVPINWRLGGGFRHVFEEVCDHIANFFELKNYKSRFYQFFLDKKYRILPGDYYQYLGLRDMPIKKGKIEKAVVLWESINLDDQQVSLEQNSLSKSDSELDDSKASDESSETESSDVGEGSEKDSEKSESGVQEEAKVKKTESDSDKDDRISDSEQGNSDTSKDLPGTPDTPSTPEIRRKINFGSEKSGRSSSGTLTRKQSEPFLTLGDFEDVGEVNYGKFFEKFSVAPSTKKIQRSESSSVGLTNSNSGKKGKKNFREKKTLSYKDRLKVGRWAERFIYEGLLSHYKEKYSSETDFSLKDTEDGFAFSFKKDGETVKYAMHWYNKIHKDNFEEDEGESHDMFMIRVRGGKEQKRFIEVKGKISEKSSEVRLTRREWRLAQTVHREKTSDKSSDAYYLYCVNNVGNRNVFFRKIKDPYAMYKSKKGIELVAKEIKL